jgi:NAD(P)-dependent dehydrogenase (short-subunit alcohol dehydrogenase family)
VPDFLNLRDHVIVVTGAASGMGRAVAQAARREGARLVLADFDGDRLKATAGELDGEVRHLRADVTRLPEIDAVFELAERESAGSTAWSPARGSSPRCPCWR